MDTKFDCYIASGFFNPKQIKDVEDIKFILKLLNLTFFSPKDHNLILPNATNLEREEGVFKNLSSIENCKFIIVNTRDKDMGTIFEAGYAFKFGLPIIYFSEGLKGDFNLMLANTGIAVATNLYELEEHIRGFINNKKYIKKYIGKIE